MKKMMTVGSFAEAEEVLKASGTIEYFEPQKAYERTQWLNSLEDVVVNALLEFHMLTTSNHEVRR